MFRVYSLSYRKIAKQLQWMLCILVLVSIVASLTAAPQPVYAAKSSDVQAFGDKHYESTSSLQNVAPLFASFSYDNTTSGTFVTQTSCTTQLTRTFSVSENLTINDLNVGLNVSHTYRGDLRITLTSPAGTVVQLANQRNDGSDNYDLLLDDSSTNSLDDGNNDTVAFPIYGADRIAKPFQALSAFNGESAQGTWILSFCNINQGHGGGDRDLTFNSAQLVFDGTTVNSNQLSGSVFQDYNSNGIQNTTGTSPSYAIDWGVGAVNAQAFCVTSLGTDGIMGTSDDVITPSAIVTTTQPSYSINTGSGLGGLFSLTLPTGVITGTAAQPSCRLEFTNLPNGYYPSFTSTGGTGVQFFNPGTTTFSYGINKPCDYCQDDPRYATNMFVNGSVTDSSNTNRAAIYSIKWGDRANATYPSTIITATTQGTVGSIWGIAYERNANALYSSAVLRRHVGLGPGGIGAIYRQASFNQTALNTPSTFYTFNASAVGTVVNNSTRFPGTGTGAGQTGPCATCENIDATTFAQAGKTGMGGIDTSEDGSTLYAVTLADRKLYALNTTGTPVATEVAGEPWLGNAVCGSTGVARPWAVTYHNESVYVGVTCDASTSSTCSATGSCADLKSQIYAFNTKSNSWATVLPTPVVLNYQREFYKTGGTTAYWHPWTDSWATMQPYVDANNSSGVDASYPQPILSDIEFDADGSLILAFLDRTGLQVGYAAASPIASSAADTSERYFTAGDLLRVGFQSGAYALEANGVVTTSTGTVLTGAGTTSPTGPGGREFYGDIWSNNGTIISDDSGLGALAQLPGASEVLYNSSDPYLTYGAGLRTYSNVNGQTTGVRQIYSGDFNGALGTMAKSGGMGDIELLCAPAPLEIGNRVWLDSNGNGIQDPGEAILSGMTITLTHGSAVTTTTTNANGEYYFRSIAGSPIQPNTQYTLSLPTTIVSGTQRFALTQPNVTGNSSNSPFTDTLDSDINATTGQLSFVTGSTGENNHSFDIGYAPTVSVGNSLWFDTNNNGLFDSGEQPISGVAVQLYRDSNGNGVFDLGVDTLLSNTVTSSSGYYSFTNLAPTEDLSSAYLVVIPNSNFSSVLTGYRNSNGNGNSSPDADSNPSDNDDNGDEIGTYGTASFIVASKAVSLTIGAEPTSEAGGNGGNDPTTDGNSNLTLDFGFYKLSVGDLVWEDYNNNGQKDSNEPGLAAVTVQLLDSGNAVISTTATDANGQYTFTGLVSGTYSIRITPPSSAYQSSSATVTNDGSNSNDHGAASGGFIVSSQFALTPGGGVGTNETATAATGSTVNINLDFGLWRPASLGDYVWEDLNHDGQQNDGNSGINGVLVTLLNGSNQIVSTTTTFTGGASSQPGYYTFTNLVSDTYHLSFTVPAGFQATIANGGSDLSDSDGVQSGNAAVTLGYALSAGQSLSTVDQGFSRLATIGDLVWNDLDRDGVFDPGDGETGIPNVTIDLWLDVDNNGVIEPITDTFVLSQTTVSNGFYQFIGLSAGNYLVDVTDSAGALTGMVLTGGSDPYDVTLSTYQQYDIADFGYAIELKADLSVVKYDLVDPIPAGSTQTYTIVVTDNGPNDAENVIITDMLPAGTSYLSDNAGCTPGSGTITCNLGTIPDGTSVTITVEVIVDSTLAMQRDSAPIGAVATQPPINST